MSYDLDDVLGGKRRDKPARTANELWDVVNAAPRSRMPHEVALALGAMREAKRLEAHYRLCIDDGGSDAQMARWTAKHKEWTEKSATAQAAYEAACKATGWTVGIDY